MSGSNKRPRSKRESDRANVDALLADALNRRADPASMATADEALLLATEIGYATGVAQAVRCRAWIAYRASRFAEARDHAAEFLRLYRALDETSYATLGEILVLSGTLNRRLGSAKEARERYDEALTLAAENGDRTLELLALVGIGILHRQEGRHEQALASHGRALELARELGNVDEELNALQGIANTHDALGRYAESLEYHERSLALAEQSGRERMQAYIKGNMAVVYIRLGDFTTALALERRALAWKEEHDDAYGASISLNNIGTCCENLGDYGGALEAYARALELAEQSGDRLSQSQALNNIGQAYETLGEARHGLDYFTRSLEIAQEIGYRHGEVTSLTNIGRVHQGAGDFAAALLHYFKALRMNEEMEEPNGRIVALNCIGSVHLQLGDPDAATEQTEQALAIAERTGAVPSRIASLLQLAKIETKRGDHAAAVTLLERALAGARDTGQQDSARDALDLLADAHAALGETVRAARRRREHQELMQRLFDAEATRRVRDVTERFRRRNLQRLGEELGIPDEDRTAIERALAGTKEAGEPRPAGAGRLPSTTVASEQDRQPPPIHVVTLGEFYVTVGDRRLGTQEWGRKRARDLFKLLLVNYRRAVTLDEIIDKLWGGTADRNVELLAMNAISHIRRAIEPERNSRDPSERLAIHDRAYTLDLGESAVVDFLRFKELIVAARRAGTAQERRRLYEAAVALYNGDFLAEDLYEEWTISERELLKDAFLEALEYLAAEHQRAGRHAEAITTARRILGHDNTSERAYETLIESLRALGRGGEARKVIEECRRAFAHELGVEPPERLGRLFVRSHPAVL